MRQQGHTNTFLYQADAGAAEAAASEADAGAAEAAASEAAASDRTFNAADVERIVRERLARVKGTPPADYEDLKAKAAKLTELEESNKTELEKAQARAEAAEKERDRVRADAAEVRLRAAILSEAAKPDRRIVDTDSVIALLDRTTLELDADGVPTNIAKAMDSLLEAKPFLVSQAGGQRGNADQGARSGGARQVTEADLKTMSPEQIMAAEREGRLAGLLGAPT